MRLTVSKPLFSIANRNVVSFPGTRIDLPWAINATGVSVSKFLPVRQPAGQSANGKHHCEHVGRNSHRPIKNTAVEVHIGVQLAFNEIGVFQGDLFQIAGDLKQMDR
jgi:hypothetical protein